MGTPCTNAIDCGDVTTQVCDPYTALCGPGQCDANTAVCPAGHTCLGEVQSPNVGACYVSCTTFTANSGCTASQFCDSVNLATHEGACFNVGTAAVNTTCTQNVISTGCVTGSICVDDNLANPVCRKACDYWTAPAGCGVGLRCGVGSLCSSATSDPAAIHGSCAAGAVVGTGCAANANAVTGACVDSGLANLECLKWCRLGGNDCVNPEVCTDVGVANVGVCF
jgi:hypothetical protein